MYSVWIEWLSQRFRNINLPLSVIWQASSLKSHSLCLKYMYNNFLPQKELSSRARSLREFHQLLWRWPLAISLKNIRKKRPNEIPRCLIPQPSCCITGIHVNPKTGKLRERAKSMKIKVKQARRKIRLWKKNIM